jgi:hypothetical protein
VQLLRHVLALFPFSEADNFKSSRAVGAWLGLTWRSFQSGEVDYDGHISRRGDNVHDHVSQFNRQVDHQDTNNPMRVSEARS